MDHQAPERDAVVDLALDLHLVGDHLRGADQPILALGDHAAELWPERRPGLDRVAEVPQRHADLARVGARGGEGGEPLEVVGPRLAQLPAHAATSNPSHAARSAISARTAFVIAGVNFTSSWIAFTRRTDALRSAAASSFPTSWSPWRIGSA